MCPDISWSSSLESPNFVQAWAWRSPCPGWWCLGHQILIAFLIQHLCLLLFGNFLPKWTMNKRKNKMQKWKQPLHKESQIRKKTAIQPQTKQWQNIFHPDKIYLKKNTIHVKKWIHRNTGTLFRTTNGNSLTTHQIKDKTATPQMSHFRPPHNE